MSQEKSGWRADKYMKGRQNAGAGLYGRGSQTQSQVGKPKSEGDGKDR